MDKANVSECSGNDFLLIKFMKVYSSVNSLDKISKF